MMDDDDDTQGLLPSVTQGENLDVNKITATQRFS